MALANFFIGQRTKARSMPVVLPSDPDALPVNLAASAVAAGLTPYRNLDLGVTGQVVKGSAGKLHLLSLFNNASSVRYVKVYDKATAPTSSDTPLITVPVAATSPGGFLSVHGLTFVNGIALRATTGIADNDTGAPATNDVVVCPSGYV